MILSNVNLTELKVKSRSYKQNVITTKKFTKNLFNVTLHSFQKCLYIVPNIRQNIH